MDSPAVQRALKGLEEGQRKKIVFMAETAYNTASPEHRVALGVNPGFLYKKDGKVYLESYAHYPYYSANNCFVKSNFKNKLYCKKIFWVL